MINNTKEMSRFDYKDITLIYDSLSENEWSTYKIFKKYGKQQIAIIGSIDLGCLDTVFIAFPGCRITIDKEYSVSNDDTEIYLCNDDIRKYRQDVYGYSCLDIEEILSENEKLAEAIYSTINDKVVNSIEGHEIIYKQVESHNELSYSDTEYGVVKISPWFFNEFTVYHIYNDHTHAFMNIKDLNIFHNNCVTLCSASPLAEQIINIPIPKNAFWHTDLPCLLSILDGMKRLG